MNKDQIIVAATIRAASRLLNCLPHYDGPTTGDGVTDEQADRMFALVEQLDLLARDVELGR